MKIKNYNIRLVRKGGTFAIEVHNLIANYINLYLVQFSFKDPWWIPSERHNYYYSINKPKNTDSLYGWLFFYFGTMHIEQYDK